MKTYTLQFGDKAISPRTFVAEQIWIKGDLITLNNQNSTGPSIIVAVIRLGPGDSISESV